VAKSKKNIRTEILVLPSYFLSRVREITINIQLFRFTDDVVILLVFAVLSCMNQGAGGREPGAGCGEQGDAGEQAARGEKAL
jgi:hypothetical protein